MKFRHRNRCHACHRRVDRAAPNVPARVRAAAAPAPSGTLRRLPPCRRAPQAAQDDHLPCAAASSRRNSGHGLCNRCTLADPDRPFRYAASIARRMGTVPAWWHELTAFAAARYHPGGAMTILRKTGRILTAEPDRERAADPASLPTASMSRVTTPCAHRVLHRLRPSPPQTTKPSNEPPTRRQRLPRRDPRHPLGPSGHRVRPGTTRPSGTADRRAGRR